MFIVYIHFVRCIIFITFAKLYIFTWWADQKCWFGLRYLLAVDPGWWLATKKSFSSHKIPERFQLKSFTFEIVASLVSHGSLRCTLHQQPARALPDFHGLTGGGWWARPLNAIHCHWKTAFTFQSSHSTKTTSCESDILTKHIILSKLGWVNLQKVPPALFKRIAHLRRKNSFSTMKTETLIREELTCTGARRGNCVTLWVKAGDVMSHRVFGDRICCRLARLARNAQRLIRSVIFLSMFSKLSQ